MIVIEWEQFARYNRHILEIHELTEESDMKRIALIVLITILMLSLLPFTTAGATQYGTVTGGWLRLRTSPSFDASILTSYYTGTVVEILGTSGSWYNVKTPDSQTGYMYSSYVTLGSSGSTGYTAYVTSTNGYGVRMRSGPSKGYRILAIYPVGTQVTVLSTGILWSRIQVGTSIGYMMSEFLTTTAPGSGTSPTTPEGSDMATVRSDNGYGVRLRSGAGTGYSIIGLYSVGTRVNVISRGTTWDYIQVGSRTGYMMNYFLKYDNSSSTVTPVATGITITAVSSTAGQGETIALNVTVTGTNLSSTPYTLAVTGNSDLASITSSNGLYIKGTAAIGSEITVTATTTDKNSSGNVITATCKVIVIEGTASNFSFDRSEASVTVAGADAQIQLSYTIDGPSGITVSVPATVSSYVTTSVDSTNKKVTVTLKSTIPAGTEFILTGTTSTDGSSGSPLTDTVKISVVTDVTLSSITLVPQSTSINQGDSTDINATLTYTNGTVVENADLTKYSLEITSGGDYATLPSGSKTLTAGTFSTLNDQTVTVKGTAAADTSKTATCEITIAANAVPNAPSLISAIPGDAQVRVSWSAPTSGATVNGYEVFYSTSYDGAKSQFGATLASDARAVTVTGLYNSTPYYFWVRATNTTGASEYSSYLTSTPNVIVPDAPTGLAVDSYAENSAVVSWVAPTYNGGAAVTNYLVYVDGTKTVESATSPATITGLTNGSPYSITVKAHNVAGDSVASTALSITLPNVPDAPVITSCTAGHEEFSVSWNTPGTNGSTISGYSVRYWTDPTDKTTVPASGNTITIPVATSACAEQHSVEVIALSNMGSSSASASQTCTPYTTAGAPASVSASGDTTRVTVTWPAADDGGKAITNYKLAYTDGGSNTGSVDVGTVLTYNLDGLVAGTYTFTVSATNDGTNYSSGTDSASTPVNTP